MKRKCRCGCGKLANLGNKYIHNHHWTGKMQSVESKKKISDAHKKCKSRCKKEILRSIPCLCGCLEMAKPGNRFINGHARRGKCKPHPKPELCHCGCGILANSGREYIFGHHRKGKSKPRPESKPCKCGCGKLARSGKSYIHGHNCWGRKLSRKTKERIGLANSKPKPDPLPCECGCGELAGSGKRFICGHSRVGKKASKSARKKMSCSMKLSWEKNRSKFIVGMNTPSARKRKSLAQKERRRNENPNTIAEHMATMRKASSSSRFFGKTKLELRVEQILSKIDKSFRYVGDCSFYIGRKNPDFISKSNKKVIEVNGAYWHKDEIREKASKRKYYKGYGYSILFIGERELKRYPIRTKNKIYGFCKSTCS